MSDSYERGKNDARDNKGPINLWNAPSTVQEKYNAGYAQQKENEKNK